MEKSDSSRKHKGKASKRKLDSREEKWLWANRDAIDAHNKRVDEHGTLLKPSWARDDD